MHVHTKGQAWMLHLRYIQLATILRCGHMFRKAGNYLLGDFKQLLEN